jgi:hypothetical protein
MVDWAGGAFGGAMLEASRILFGVVIRIVIVECRGIDRITGVPQMVRGDGRFVGPAGRTIVSRGCCDGHDPCGHGDNPPSQEFSAQENPPRPRER